LAITCPASAQAGNNMVGNLIHGKKRRFGVILCASQCKKNSFEKVRKGIARENSDNCFGKLSETGEKHLRNDYVREHKGGFVIPLNGTDLITPVYEGGGGR